MDFKIRLRQLRRQAGLTQHELSDRLDFVPGTISSYETGRTQPGFTDLIRIAQLFGTSTDYLLGITPPRDEAERDADRLTEKFHYLSPRRRRQLLHLIDLYLELDGSAYFEKEGQPLPLKPGAASEPISSGPE